MRLVENRLPVPMEGVQRACPSTELSLRRDGESCLHLCHTNNDIG